MASALLPLLTFLAVVSAIAVLSLLGDLFLRDRKRVQGRLDDEFRSIQRDKIKRSLLFKQAESSSFDPSDGGPVTRRTWRDWLQEMLDQAGLDCTPKGLLGFCGASAGGSGLIVGLLTRSPLLGLIAAAVCAWIPIGYVRYKRNARLEKLRSQLSDAFDLMARVLRAGQSMGQAMQAVARELSSPIAEEFAYCSEQQNLGLAPEISMRDLAKRTALVDVNIFVVAVLVQRQVGGNLSEILEKLAVLVRQRYQTRGMIRTLTAEGRMQAAVLMALPPLLLLVMLIANRDYAKVLIDKPALIGAMAFFMALGGLWIRKIVNFDF